jgi:hypothetical protein
MSSALLPGQANSGAGTANKQPFINPSVQADYLRQPDGLTRLSSRYGDITLGPSPEELWGEWNLHSLASKSDLVVIGRITDGTSSLTDDGDHIKTTYAVDVLKAFKGTELNSVVFDALGGRVKLGTGYFATIHTKAFDSLHIGETYVLFLKNWGNKYTLRDSIQGVMKIESDGTVHLLDTQADRNVDLRRHVEGMQRSFVEHLILNSIQ